MYKNLSGRIRLFRFEFLRFEISFDQFGKSQFVAERNAKCFVQRRIGPNDSRSGRSTAGNPREKRFSTGLSLRHVDHDEVDESNEKLVRRSTAVDRRTTNEEISGCHRRFSPSIDADERLRTRNADADRLDRHGDPFRHDAGALRRFDHLVRVNRPNKKISTSFFSPLAKIWTIGKIAEVESTIFIRSSPTQSLPVPSKSTEFLLFLSLIFRSVGIQLAIISRSSSNNRI